MRISLVLVLTLVACSTPPETPDELIAHLEGRGIDVAHGATTVFGEHYSLRVSSDAGKVMQGFLTFGEAVPVDVTLHSTEERAVMQCQPTPEDCRVVGSWTLEAFRPEGYTGHQREVWAAAHTKL